MAMNYNHDIGLNVLGSLLKRQKGLIIYAQCSANSLKVHRRTSIKIQMLRPVAVDYSTFELFIDCLYI